MPDLRVLGVVLLVLLSVQHSECVQCFGRFDRTKGQCHEAIGEVDEDECCQNPHYGYQAEDGVCRSCGPPSWSPWSPWSHCNVLCGEGVTYRSRTCFGIGQSECEDSADNRQIKPCNGTCCDVEGWGSWQAWAPCRVTCGVGGVRTRTRACSSPPECRSACSGPSEEEEACPAQGVCPGQGQWAAWSYWSQCSGSCINDQVSNIIIPTRERVRACIPSAPLDYMIPAGNDCPGEYSQVQDCSDIPNCRVDGSWGNWAPAGPCSVSCGEGLRLIMRRCDKPAPKYGGKFCEGPSTRSSACQSPCPVDGHWTGWSPWGECSSSCIPQGSVPVRTRRRTCSNPAPSSNPPGRSCQGNNEDTEMCDHLPHCQVDGGWGSWSPFSASTVTCGVGAQVSERKCENPAPQHGGKPCSGDARRTTIFRTNAYCPVDGVWSGWSPWQECKYPFGDRNIRCKLLGGSQVRVRECLYRAHNGSICSGEDLTERRVCYDVSSCYVKGTWDGWGTWSLCREGRGGQYQRIRERHCKPDYSKYSPTIGRHKEMATFFGKPQADCGAVPDNGKKFEVQPCLNVPVL